MRTQSGNALWFILLAIFLLGGLTVLLSRTGSNTEETGSTEKATLKASDILNYSASVKTGVQQLLSRGCGENDISFWYDENADGVEDGSDSYYNATSPTDRSCHVFSDKGAGLKKKLWEGTYTIYNEYVARTTFPGLGTTAADLYWVIEFSPAIDRLELCKNINKILGNPAGSPPVLGGIWGGPKFTGTYYEPSTPVSIDVAAINGKKSYCYDYASGPGRYVFYDLLIIR